MQASTLSRGPPVACAASKCQSTGASQPVRRASSSLACGGDGRGVTQHRHADCKGRVAVREVGGAIQRVDTPQVLAVGVPCGQVGKRVGGWAGERVAAGVGSGGSWQQGVMVQGAASAARGKHTESGAPTLCSDNPRSSTPPACPHIARPSARPPAHHLRAGDSPDTPPSSPSTAWPGKAPWMTARMAASLAVSVSVTRSVAPLNCTLRGLSTASRMICTHTSKGCRQAGRPQQQRVGSRAQAAAQLWQGGTKGAASMWCGAPGVPSPQPALTAAAAAGLRGAPAHLGTGIGRPLRHLQQMLVVHAAPRLHHHRPPCRRVAGGCSSCWPRHEGRPDCCCCLHLCSDVGWSGVQCCCSEAA